MPPGPPTSHLLALTRDLLQTVTTDPVLEKRKLRFKKVSDPSKVTQVAATLGFE